MLTGTLWKYASGGLAVLCLVLFILLRAEQAHSAKVEKRAQYYRSEFQRISTQKDEQRQTTDRNIKAAEEKVRVVEKVVTKLESRPVTGQACETPDLEEWRNIL